MPLLAVTLLWASTPHPADAATNPVELVQIYRGAAGDLGQELLLERRCPQDVVGPAAAEGMAPTLEGDYVVTTVGAQRVRRQNKSGGWARTRLIGTGSLGAEYQQAPDQSFTCGGPQGTKRGTDEIGAENYRLPSRAVKRVRVRLRYRAVGNRRWTFTSKVMRLGRPKIATCVVTVSKQPVSTAGSAPPQSEDADFTVGWEQWGFARSCGMGLSARGAFDPLTADRSAPGVLPGESDAAYEQRTHGVLGYEWAFPGQPVIRARDVEKVAIAVPLDGLLTVSTSSGSSATWSVRIRRARSCDFELCGI